MLRFVRRGADNRQPLGEKPLWLSSILRSRGIDTEEKAERFLHPDLADLHDPLLMQGMDRALRIIRQAVADGTPIQIYGDYDADGVCATAILMETLTGMGARVDYRIPSRHEEGYGLNADAVREMAKEHRLLITVDCGVTNHEEVHLAQLLGMTVIVTDHHQLAETPSPADVVLNPLLGDYPFRRLCGAGVALKIVQGLLGMEEVMRRIDLAALATVADLVPLIDENRVIVRYGLEKMADGSRPGLAALMLLAGVGAPVSSGQVAFRLAPRINAGGRLEDAAQCVRLLISRDPQEAEKIAQHLEQQNQQRQAMQTDITAQAESKMASSVDFRDDLVIVVMGEDWNSGVIGLAAGRLCEKYHFPTIVLSRQGDIAVGSCRSIPGVNIHAMLTACADLFMRFGGHEQAAGLTMRPELVPELRRRLNLAIREKCDLSCYIPAKEYDFPLSLESVTLELIDLLESLQPTGFGNPAPVFLSCGAQVQQARPVGRDGAHLKMNLLEGNAVRDGIAFHQGHLAQDGLDMVDVLYAPERNEFRGHVTAQLQISALRPAEGSVALPGDDALFRGLLQEMTLLAANHNKIPQMGEGGIEGIAEAGVRRLLKDGRGTLLLAHTGARAALFAGGMLDVDTGRVRDVRGFNTLLLAPEMDALTDLWQHVVLLDGDVLPGEAAAIQERCPRAALHAMKPSEALQQLLDSLAMADDPLRSLYRRVRQGGQMLPGALASDTGLTEAQVLVGLMAFAQVNLVQFRLQPYALVLLPPVKCRMDDSLLIRYLRGQRKT